MRGGGKIFDQPIIQMKKKPFANNHITLHYITIAFLSQ